MQKPWVPSDPKAFSSVVDKSNEVIQSKIIGANTVVVFILPIISLNNAAT